MLGWQVLQLRTTVERERGDTQGCGVEEVREDKDGEIKGGKRGRKGAKGEHEKQFRWRGDGDRKESQQHFDGILNEMIKYTSHKSTI